MQPTTRRSGTFLKRCGLNCAASIIYAKWVLSSQTPLYSFTLQTNQLRRVLFQQKKQHVKGFMCVQFCNLDFSKITYYLQN